MSHSTSLQRTVACCAALVMLAGCATTGSNGNTASGDSNPCSPGVVALGAGVLGAVIGGAVAGKKGAVAGAALGGAAGYALCMAYSVQTVQRQNAQEVEARYRQQNGNLPAYPQVVSYRSSLATNGGAVQRGQRFGVQSDVEVVNGRNQPINSVREELVLFNPEGKQINQDPSSKPFTARSGGMYENSFALTLPPNSPQGEYGIKTNLFVNEQLVATRDLQAKVVWVDDKAQIVQIAAR